MNRMRTSDGFTLVELALIIVIIGIITAVAVNQMSVSLDTAKMESTKSELDELAFAIAGNPALMSNGARTDFGYVGDVGGLPPNLDALAQNPGGYATWDGPYIESSGSTEYKRDGWGVDLTYADTLIRSTGSGANIDKIFVSTRADLLANSVMGFVVDANLSMPGTIFDDSLKLQLAIPNGSGGVSVLAVNTDARGNFTFNNVPIGNHSLTAIYIPDNDTIRYNITVTPNSIIKLDVIFPHDLW